MAKRKKLHKIVIHPNRYLIWACAVAIIVAAGLVSYSYISGISIVNQLGPESDTTYWHTYKDANLSLRYPADWLVDPGPSYVGFGTKLNDHFLVYTYSSTDDPAYNAYAQMASSRHINVDGVLGFRVNDPSNPNQRIAFVKTSKKLYEFRGDNIFFDQILDSVKFTKK